MSPGRISAIGRHEACVYRDLFGRDLLVGANLPELILREVLKCCRMFVVRTLVERPKIVDAGAYSRLVNCERHVFEQRLAGVSLNHAVDRRAP